jgi:GDPmannose 4,6-dehydratase
LITDITGQDDSYMAALFLEKDYVVHGIKRRASSWGLRNASQRTPSESITSTQSLHESDPRLLLHYGDPTTSTNLIRIIQQVQPDKNYNIGVQSHVAMSF